MKIVLIVYMLFTWGTAWVCIMHGYLEESFVTTFISCFKVKKIIFLSELSLMNE